MTKGRSKGGRGVSAGSGFEVTEASTVAEALEHLENFAFDIVLTHLGSRTAKARRSSKWPARDNGHPVIVVTGHGSIRAAVDAIRQGAADFVTKPFQLAELTWRSGGRSNGNGCRRRTPTCASSCGSATGWRNSSAGARRCRRCLRSSDGGADHQHHPDPRRDRHRQGAGRARHPRDQRRAPAEFVAMNCGAVPESLLEAELFGHEKGAFTGAVASGPAASSSPMAAPCSSTRSARCRCRGRRSCCAPCKSARSSGSARHGRQVDVRVLAATNVNLASSRQGTFREDLFYRLNVIPSQLPPLRERGDVPLLVRDMLQRLGAQSVPVRTDVTFSQERCGG